MPLINHEIANALYLITGKTLETHILTGSIDL